VQGHALRASVQNGDLAGRLENPAGLADALEKRLGLGAGAIGLSALQDGRVRLAVPFDQSATSA
jgi:hypothetical protein